MSAHPAWVLAAWKHWHLPWVVADPSWLHDTGPAAHSAGRELARRLHYAAWCTDHGLSSDMSGFADSLAWRLVAATREVFDRTSQLAGLTWLYAADPRRRLLSRDQAAHLVVARWALERAQLLPPDLVRASLDPSMPRQPSHCAAASLRACVATAEPVTWPRLRQRLPRECVVEVPAMAPQGAAMHARRVWSAAFEQAVRMTTPSAEAAR